MLVHYRRKGWHSRVYLASIKCYNDAEITNKTIAVHEYNQIISESKVYSLSKSQRFYLRKRPGVVCDFIFLHNILFNLRKNLLSAPTSFNRKKKPLVLILIYDWLRLFKMLIKSYRYSLRCLIPAIFCVDKPFFKYLFGTIKINNRIQFNLISNLLLPAFHAFKIAWKSI